MANAERQVRAQLEIQGWSAGERPIWVALGRAIPLARVRRVLRELKRVHRQRLAGHRAAARTSTKVLLKDAVWSMDATHLGRDGQEQAVQAEVLREVASGCTLQISVGPPARGTDVARLLDRAVAARGTAPLVLLTDNGPQYSGQAVASWCAARGVQHLFSLPHTPQHNAASEHGMRELKEETLLGEGVRVIDNEAARGLLLEAVERLDAGRLRASRDWRTARQDDLQRPPWWTRLTRAAFLEKVSCAIQEALLHSKTKRARRRALREAILSSLEHCSAIQRTRDGR